ncbi:hypothetical protein MMSR116_11045 [Methylobacterium mesophilicum SR1.6/6]|uniref:Uncharacterized protein n=1 Tax=Methylobacterium mesophilicum SR1.6/6 TaxID=908290 RepID=A0A6B9FIA8_9HYPH|nr:hypothetical protein [Methylobacterium mesophilicum]QGY02351.1 hypothetical protein MMSR116_11045 [Methylobacterium mesophilicum SR1.6/6]
MGADTRATLDLSTIDPLHLALAAETAARASLDAAGIFGACSERPTARPTVRMIEHGQAMATLARLMAVLGQNWEVIEPVLEACLRGDIVAIEEAAPVRAGRDERPALALVAR